MEPDLIDAVVAELESTHVIDDARYAERFTDDRRELSGWGPERIELELRKRGIPEELIAPALSRRSRQDELAAARGLLAERFAALEGDRARNRAWQLLVRRGYDAELLTTPSVRTATRPDSLARTCTGSYPLRSGRHRPL